MNTFTLRYELIDRRYSRGIRCRNVSNLEDGKIVYTFKKYFWKRIFRRRAKAIPFRTENTFPISRNSTYLHTVPTFDAQLHPTFSNDKVTLTWKEGMQNRDQSDKWWPRVGSSRKFTAPPDRSSREMKRFPFACKAPPVDWPWTSVCHCENERTRRCVLLFARRPIPT